MKDIYIVHRAMFDSNGEVNVIGGIESYILSLIDICSGQGWKVHVVQPARSFYTIEKENYCIHGICTGVFRGNLKKIALAKWIKKRANREQDIIIFATDTYAVSMPKYKTVSIQHGISWDKPREQKNMLLQMLSSFINQCKYLSYTQKSKTMVCVDHNFINWYRTWFNADSKVFKIIYNFYQEKITDAEFDSKWDNEFTPLKIIIARRFVDYRGIKLIAPVIKNIINKHPNVQVSFAGDGPLKSYLETMFVNDKRVLLTQYQPSDSFEFHKQHHIAIIPTLGSEGTSLSMIEAMAAGCMVVSSNVGGLSNLIINGYNGCLTMPTEIEIQQALDGCLSNLPRTKQLAHNGLESIKIPCSKEKWGKDWIDVINSL